MFKKKINLSLKIDDSPVATSKPQPDFQHAHFDCSDHSPTDQSFSAAEETKQSNSSTND